MVQCCSDCTGVHGFRVEPDTGTAIEHDYWEEVANVQNVFISNPTVALKRNQVSGSRLTKCGSLENGDAKNDPNQQRSSSLVPVEQVRPRMETNYDVYKSDANCANGEIAQIEMNVRDVNGPHFTNTNENVQCGNGNHVCTSSSVTIEPDKELGHCFCFCCRTGTPCYMWLFMGFSIVFFKMGAIVTGRWIYLWQSSYDEFAFYAAFSLNLGFATYYFRHGTKHHNPFDMLCLVVTGPLLWGLLSFTTIMFKKDIFFYIAMGFYSALMPPYLIIGIFITCEFHKIGRLFMKRIEGNMNLEPLCRNLFFAHSLMIFDMQAILTACIVGMAPSINHPHTFIWVASLIYGPLCVAATISWFCIGYFAMRRENKILTWIFFGFSGNPFVLVIGMILKLPEAQSIVEIFRNFIIISSMFILLVVHVSLVLFVWKRVVPSYGKGLRKSLARTSENSCIQCAEITICR